MTDASSSDALAQLGVRAFFESCPFGVIIIDRAQRIVTVNPQQATNSDIPLAQFKNGTLRELFSGVIRRYSLEEPLRQLLEERRPLDIKFDRYEGEYIRRTVQLRIRGCALTHDLFAIMTDGDGASRHGPATEIVGTSARMDAVHTFIERAARVSTTVLVVGESGTGKELVARAIYARSDRAREPFLALNCAALPGTLLESTLFGSERGAYTGADRRTKGYFEAAEGGVLLLDEIGDTSLEFQVKLLRVLEDGKVTRLGGTEPIRTNVRVICATNRDLDREVAEKRFRQDLYFRINILRIELPPLRERADDIPLIAQHYLGLLNGKHRLGRKHLSRDALEAIMAYRWPGNVRELANALEAAYVTTPDNAISLEQMPMRIRDAALLDRTAQFEPHSYRHALEQFRREYASRMLEFARGDIREAARLARVNPSTLYRNGGRSGLKPRASRAT